VDYKGKRVLYRGHVPILNVKYDGDACGPYRDWQNEESMIQAPAGNDVAPGFRNMGDPQEDADPDHYSEFIVTSADNGGVHSNSGISNHAYYLAVNGGKNAGCDAVGSNGHQHTADCGVTVPALGVGRAAEIFYAGFTSLPEFANICDARNATVAVAGADAAATSAAWEAVGVKSGCTPGVPPPPACVGDPNAQIPFESPHPYGNNGDCTWAYNNGSGGFAFRRYHRCRNDCRLARPRSRMADFAG